MSPSCGSSAPSLARRLVLFPIAAILLWPASTSTQTDLGAKWFRWVPEVVRQTETGPVRLEVAVTGDPTQVVFAYAPNATSPSARASASYQLHDDGADGDTMAGDGVYTVTLPAPMLVRDLGPQDASDRLVGFLKVYKGAEAALAAQVHIAVLTGDIPPVDITGLAPDVQASRHVVNILDPGFAERSDYGRAYRRFYDFFDDDYFGFNVVTLPSRFLNRFGGALQADATGIGEIPSSLSPTSGSNGGLFHVSVFPLLYYFDGAEQGFNHELGHQWVNYLRAVPGFSGFPHWPVSSLAGGVMGWGTGEGLEFPCTITEEGAALRMQRRTSQPGFTDFDLYLMGLLPAGEVRDALILPYADTMALPCSGGLYTGPFQRLRIQEVIDAVGERRPAAGQARRRFRIATIVVSEDQLLDADAMAYLDQRAQRMELTDETQIHAGFVKTMGKPFAVATRGLGSIDATVTPRTGPDFSMAVSPRQLTVGGAEPVRVTIHLDPKTGWTTAPVTLECFSTAPLRPCTFDPPVPILGASGVDVVMSVPSWGTGSLGYKWVVRATVGSLRHTTDVQLVVR